MKQAVIMLALAALCATVSATDLYWTNCGPASTKINKVEIPQCNNTMVKNRCALKRVGHFNLKIDFIQGQIFSDPWFEIKYDKSIDIIHYGRCVLGMDCPGEIGQEQHLHDIGYAQNLPPNSKNATIRYIVTEPNEMTPVHLCIDIPVYI